MGKSLWTKGFVFGIVLLFIEASVIPIFSAYSIDSEIINRDKNITPNIESEINNGIETTSLDPIFGGTIALGWGAENYVNISVNHVFDIDVGNNGDTVTIYVNYTMNCGAWFDYGYVEISFANLGEVDSAETNGYLTGTLFIEKFCYPSENFSVRLYGYYSNWDGATHVWNDTKYSYFSTKDPVVQVPPNPPYINGPTSGNVGEMYTYTFVAIDPNDDNISYEIDWGDGIVDNWTEFVESNEVISRSHNWTEEGTYNISARAKDVNDNIGNWGKLSVTMPLDVGSQQSTQIALLRSIKNNALK